MLNYEPIDRRRKVAEKLIMQTLPTQHDWSLSFMETTTNFEFRRTLNTGAITGEILISTRPGRTRMGFGKNSYYSFFSIQRE